MLKVTTQKKVLLQAWLLANEVRKIEGNDIYKYS